MLTPEQLEAAWLKMSKEELEALETNPVLQAHRARTSLAEFIKQAWPIIEPTTPLVWGRHLDAICLHVEAVFERQIKNLLIEIPPGTLKSTTISVCAPAQRWLKYPEDRFLTASYSHALAVRDSARARRIIESDWYKRCKEVPWELSDDQNLKERYETNKTGYRITTSCRGEATGDRCLWEILDDPHNVRQAESDTIRNETINWFNEAFFNRVNQPKLGGRIIVGQRTNQHDLIGSIKGDPNWVVLTIPEQFEEANKCVTPLWQDWRKEEGEWLRPEVFGEAERDEFIRRNGTFSWNAQHQQRPTPRGGAVFKREWYKKRYRRDGDFYLIDGKPPINKKDVWHFAICDPAGGTSASADYTCAGIFAVTKWNDLIIEQIARSRTSLQEIPQYLLDVVKPWRCTYVGFEDFFLQAQVAEECRRTKGMPPVRGLGKKKDKYARSLPAQVKSESGQVWLPEKAAWLEAFLDELLIFTGKGDKHDDQVDVLSWAASEVQNGESENDWCPTVRLHKAIAS